MTADQAPLRIVIAGGGVAGLEAALALRHAAGDLVAIELLTPEPDYLRRPESITSPFDEADVPRLPLQSLSALGVTVRRGVLNAVDPERHELGTSDGLTLAYDRLVVAVGARARESVPGATHFHGPLHAGAVEGAVAAVAADPDRPLIFAVPAGVTWPLPLYELAFLSAATLATRGVEEPAVTIVTEEPRPLAVFGRSASDAVARLLERARIEVRTEAVSRAVYDGCLLLSSGELLSAGEVVTLPALEGPCVSGLPHDDAGFLQVDADARVADVADVFAAGDATAGPIKQGGLAAQQADAAAARIAWEAGALVEPAPRTPVLRGMLLTGAAPLYLRAVLDRSGRGQVSRSPLWTPPGKVAGRYLTGYLAGADPKVELEDLQRPVAMPADTT